MVADWPNKRLPETFARLRFAEAIDRYGTDKPDLRFGLEIADVTAVLGGRTELPMFSEAPAAGHVIRALRAPGGGRRSRKWFDAFAEAAKSGRGGRELAAGRRRRA